MSVYTPVTHHDIEALLGEYSVGRLQTFAGIEAGIENSNFFLSTSGGEYVLTIFEHASIDDLEFDLNLLDYLAHADIPCPRPLERDDGSLLSRLAGKPAALTVRLAGQSIDRPNTDHCAQVGHWLARLHLAGRDFPQQRANPRGPAWARVMLEELRPCLDQATRALLEQELAFQKTLPRGRLPQGLIHADLFRDNVLFADGQLSGLLDFYDASHDALLYDVAVTVNDWCSLDDGHLDPAPTAALLAAYQLQRPFRPEEVMAWPGMLRAAALRFWLSRLHHLHFPRTGQLTQHKDPEVFARILVLLQGHIAVSSMARSGQMLRLHGRRR